MVYEHPRDADTDTILDQFQCRSSKAEGFGGALAVSWGSHLYIGGPQPSVSFFSIEWGFPRNIFNCDCPYDHMGLGPGVRHI